MKVNIAGVLVDNVSKDEAVEAVSSLVRSREPGYIVTPYSEMIVFALNNPQYKNVLNNAAMAIPDGIGILWAAKYLSSKNINILGSLLAILFRPQYIQSIIKERVTGSRLIYDIAKMATENNYSLSLIGGNDNVAVQSARELKKLYPNLKVNLALSGRSFDAKMRDEIAASNSDILLIAYSPPKQEMWLAENLSKLNVKAAIGLGGTFDYIAEKNPPAPNFAHYLGLEWLWRLITQPRRWKRMWKAVPVFIWKIYKYKINSRLAG